MKFTPHAYQEYAIQHIIEHPYCGLFLDMGLGKTVSTLTALSILQYETMEVNKVLVIAPKRVAEDTWTNEVAKWDHLKHLRIVPVLGSERSRKEALRTKADIYVINRENVAWLVAQYQNAFPFDTIVIDELSSFKSPKSQRFKALRLVRPRVSRVIGLTGTPAPNGLIDLWSQLYLLDRGERLGKTVTEYRSTYFVPGRSNGHVVFDYKAKKGSEDAIHNQISDICISMKAVDHLTLPECIHKEVRVKLTPEQKKRYEEFEKEQVLQLIEGEEISAINAAALSNKLQQFANGAIYDEDSIYHEIHTAKLEALEEIIEEAQGSNILLFYNFKHDAERIEKRFKKLHTERIKGSEDIRRWNEGKIPLYIAHPASAGHGLNLQQGGDIIVWFGPTWSLELYQQANARLHRQGRTRPVCIVQIVSEGTIDEEITKAIGKKEGVQESLLQAVKARIEKYRRR